MLECDICHRPLVSDREIHAGLCENCIEELWLTDDELVTEDDVEE